MDFNLLVLGPTLAIFGQPIVVTPGGFQPTAAPYAATGVFEGDPTSVTMEDGSVISTTIYTLGIQLSAFVVSPAPGDQIATAGFTFLVDRVHPDGQGGAMLTLKRLT